MATHAQLVALVYITGCEWNGDPTGDIEIYAPDHFRFNASDAHCIVIPGTDPDGHRVPRAQKYAGAIEDITGGFYPCPEDCDCWIEDPADDIEDGE